MPADTNAFLGALRFLTIRSGECAAASSGLKTRHTCATSAPTSDDRQSVSTIVHVLDVHHRNLGAHL